MDKGLAFFRLFDVAFFIPGAIVFAVLWVCGWLKWMEERQTNQDVRNFFLVCLVIIGVYILGLFVHGIQRGLSRLINWNNTSGRVDKIMAKIVGVPTSDPWYGKLEKAQRDELAMYFWYLRATCRNTAVALLIGAGLLWYGDLLNGKRAIWLGVIAAVLVIVGYEYSTSVGTVAKTFDAEGSKTKNDKMPIAVSGSVRMIWEDGDAKTASSTTKSVRPASPNPPAA